MKHGKSASPSRQGRPRKNAERATRAEAHDFEHWFEELLRGRPQDVDEALRALPRWRRPTAKIVLVRQLGPQRANALFNQAFGTAALEDDLEQTFGPEARRIPIERDAAGVDAEAMA